MVPSPTSKLRKPRGKRAEIAAWIAREHPGRIGEPEWNALLRLLAPVSENYLRRLLRECGVPLEPVVEGVRQESLDALEASLLVLAEEYQRGDAARRSQVRRMVIAAKDHARWAARRAEARALRQEMALWLLNWLENPTLFPEWVRLRRRALGRTA